MNRKKKKQMYAKHTYAFEEKIEFICWTDRLADGQDRQDDCNMSAGTIFFSVCILDASGKEVCIKTG